MTFQVNNLIGFGVGGDLPVLVEYQAVLSDTVNRSTYTFAGAALGSVAADRLVAVRIHTGGGSTADINSVTIGGVSATLIKPASGATGSKACIAYAVVPTGTTGGIVISLSASHDHCLIRVASLYNLQSTTPSSGSKRDGSGTSTSVTVTAQAGGVVLACSTTGADTRHTYTNITENYDQGLEGGTGMSGAEDNILIGGSLTITSATAGSTNRELVAAAWR